MASTIGTLLTASYCMFLALEFLALMLLRDLVLLLGVLRPIQWAQQIIVRCLRNQVSAASKRQQLTSLLLRMLIQDIVLYMLSATLLLHWRQWWPWFTCAMAIVLLSMAQMWREYVKEIAPDSPADGTAV